MYPRRTIRQTLRCLWLAGNRFVCPCCGGHFRKLLPYGIKKRPNAQCPRCGSRERERLLCLYLKNRTNIYTDKLKALHVAPEPVIQEKLKRLPNLDYVSADLSSPLAMVKMDITAIPYDDNTFDVIICNHVLEHIPDDRKAMRELCRVLKPADEGGWAILQVPIDRNREKTFEDESVTSPEDRERVFGQRDHVRVYGRDYEDRLEEAGFTVKVEEYAGELGEEAARRYGLDEGEGVYFCGRASEGAWYAGARG